MTSPSLLLSALILAMVAGVGVLLWWALWQVSP